MFHRGKITPFILCARVLTKELSDVVLYNCTTNYSSPATSLQLLVSAHQYLYFIIISTQWNPNIAVMTIRLHAMYGRSRKILVLMVALWVSGISVAAVGYLLIIIYGDPAVHTVDPCSSM